MATKKKKIVLVQSMAYTLAGMTAASIYIAEMLSSMGCDVNIITRDQTKVTNTLRHYSKEELHDYYSISNKIPITEMEYEPVYGAGKEYFSTKFINTLESADIVISFNEGLASLSSILNMKEFWVFYHFPSPNAPPDCNANVMCNSYYTASHVMNYYDTYPTVVYPLPSWKNYTPADKKDIDILWVGRFSNDKNIGLLNKVVDRVNCTVVAVGADWWDQFSPKKLDSRIQVVKNAKIADLRDYYSRAKIVLSTKGYGERDPDPSKREHFGITLVEGAYCGAVPLVHRSGGPYLDFLGGKEGVCGYSYSNFTMLWNGVRKILDPGINTEQLRKNALDKAREMYDRSYAVLEGVVNGKEKKEE